MKRVVLVRGGGDLATGVAHRLHRAGYGIVIAELAQPLVVRRTVAFASAVFDGSIEIEGVRAFLAGTAAEATRLIGTEQVAVMIDPDGNRGLGMRPDALVDAIMAKRNTGTRLRDAPVVIALGPGFTAGEDCHAVVETQRGHDLGRVYYAGSAAPDSREPNAVGGVTHGRVLRAPRDGPFVSSAEIGQRVSAGESVGTVAGSPVVSQTDGVLRGLLANGTEVTAGLKVGDIDPRANPDHCRTISDKARAVGGGVLEALLHFERSTFR